MVWKERGLAMQIQVTNNMLNIGILQEKLDRIVFESIDTTQNWEKALTGLEQLHTQVVDYFREIGSRSEEVLPKTNTYWLLFLNSAAKVVYFYHVAKQHITTAIDETMKQQLIANFIAASCILPNNLAEDNEELMNEIEKSIQQLDPTVTLSRTANQLTDCLKAFEKYTEQ